MLLFRDGCCYFFAAIIYQIISCYRYLFFDFLFNFMLVQNFRCKVFVKYLEISRREKWSKEIVLAVGCRAIPLSSKEFIAVSTNRRLSNESAENLLIIRAVCVKGIESFSFLAAKSGQSIRAVRSFRHAIQKWVYQGGIVKLCRISRTEGDLFFLLSFSLTYIVPHWKRIT